MTTVPHTCGPSLALGTMFPREAGVVRGEAICDALVPVPSVSVTDGSRVRSFGPPVCVTVVPFSFLWHYYRYTVVQSYYTSFFRGLNFIIFY